MFSWKYAASWPWTSELLFVMSCLELVKNYWAQLVKKISRSTAHKIKILSAQPKKPKTHCVTSVSCLTMLWMLRHVKNMNKTAFNHVSDDVQSSHSSPWQILNVISLSEGILAKISADSMWYECNWTIRWIIIQQVYLLYAYFILSLFFEL